jgi:hypothetical protein
MTIKIGADPEVFLRSKSLGMFVSATGLFEGTKEDPMPLGNYGTYQVDGHALEFNSIPAESEDDFVTNVTNIFIAVKDLVANTDPDLEIVLEPIAKFDPFYFETLPLHSKELGCTPDFSMDDGKMIPAPTIGNVPIRTSSGHIHIGWTDSDDAFDDKVFRQRLAVAQKVTPHLLEVSKKWETPASIERRKYYGGHGAFRPKPYGVELRALDCLWLESEDRMREVYRAAVDSFKELGIAA